MGNFIECKNKKNGDMIDITNIKTEPIEDSNIQSLRNNAVTTLQTMSTTENILNTSHIKKETVEQELFTNLMSDDVKQNINSIISPLSLTKPASTKTLRLNIRNLHSKIKVEKNEKAMH